MVDKSDLLRPVDIATRIGDVLFTVGQVCTIARITKMQLDLWTERASIATLGVKQRLYNADAVEHVMLIAQARDLGFSVDSAIEAAEAFRGDGEILAGPETVRRLGGRYRLERVGNERLKNITETIEVHRIISPPSKSVLR